ncbi:alpha-ketoglutarate-dependent dioxygenase AlkB family protein [Variovorax sp. GB1P17]|uniref:alpha-ketoglutarate-dependent dioxygenase AlkB family protein n=1 Tax=Variovorax sp. GB1P17 TaxID=3443740 RepID=UPI003F45F923
MTFDLFDDEVRLRHVDIPDADVYFGRDFGAPMQKEKILKELIEETPWRQEEVTVWGRKHLQPRLIAWFGDAGSRYSYSGINLEPLPWTDTLLQLRAIVQGAADEKFNSVLLNFYRDHRDSMGFHSDDEPELGPAPTIASFSFGETRIFVMKHKILDIKSIRLELVSGSLLVMKGATQRNWKHGIEKLSQPCGPRVNLTFRRINST